MFSSALDSKCYASKLEDKMISKLNKCPAYAAILFLAFSKATAAAPIGPSETPAKPVKITEPVSRRYGAFNIAISNMWGKMRVSEIISK